MNEMKITIRVDATPSANDATWWRVMRIINDAVNQIEQTIPEDAHAHLFIEKPANERKAA